jgi:hypothetical protein
MKSGFAGRRDFLKQAGLGSVAKVQTSVRIAFAHRAFGALRAFTPRGFGVLDTGQHRIANLARYATRRILALLEIGAKEKARSNPAVSYDSIGHTIRAPYLIRSALNSDGERAFSLFQIPFVILSCLR